MRSKQIGLILNLVILSFLLNACGLIPAAFRPSLEDPGTTSSEGTGSSHIDFPPRSNTGLEAITLTVGKHDVGRDEAIPPGRYLITGKGRGTINIYKHGVLYISEILGWPAFGVDSLTVDLQEEYRVECSELESITLSPITTEEKRVLSSGEWVVGLDLTPDRYTVSVGEEESGRIFIYDTAGYVRYSENIGGVLTPDTLDIELKLGEILIVSNLDELNIRTDD